MSVIALHPTKVLPPPVGIFMQTNGTSAPKNSSLYDSPFTEIKACFGPNFSTSEKIKFNLF